MTPLPQHQAQQRHADLLSVLGESSGLPVGRPRGRSPQCIAVISSSVADGGLTTEADAVLTADEARHGADETCMGELRRNAVFAAVEADRALKMAVTVKVAGDVAGWWIEAVEPLSLDAAGQIRHVVGMASASDAALTAGEALLRVDPTLLEDFLHPQFDDEELELLTVGIPASPGAVSGRVVLSADDAIAAAGRGEFVILVRPETSPEDVLGIRLASGILTGRGGLVSHAAVVARGCGTPAVVGTADLRFDQGGVRVGGRTLHAGDEISIDGKTGRIYFGATSAATAAAPVELETLLAWADTFRAGRVGVRANADNAADAQDALAMGADGIGLCRTEHMFLTPERLPLMRRLVLSDDPDEEGEILAALEEAQREDFEALLRVLDGQPITVRLLDPPLHEFLPPLEPLLIDEAREQLTLDGQAELAAVRRLHEVNPMIGTRGVRVGVMKPGLYAMQVRALVGAMAALTEGGVSSSVEVMIPLVVDPAEMRRAREWVDDALAEFGLGAGALAVGTMVETPRAALLAAELASEATFFSFGTNDLTQLTYAFSRDDVEARLIPAYIQEGLIPSNPFEHLDEVGVGRLIRTAAEEGRSVRPDLKLGACGEHAGDPRSTQFFVKCGLDYISCSPYRIPIARLAVARALLELGRVDPAAVTSRPSQAHVSVDVPTMVATDADAVGPRLNDEAQAFDVLHAVRLKGFASLGTISEMTGLATESVSQWLARLEEDNVVCNLESRGLWQLTPSGRERYLEAVPVLTAEELDRLRTAYSVQFPTLNSRFKELCTAWQIYPDGTPSDHSDDAYDAACIADLHALHADAESLLDKLARAVGRLARYRVRLAEAAQRVISGDRRMFTGVMCESYHDIWMELHEDLLFLLDINRADEDSF